MQAHFSIAWHGKKNFFFQAADAAQMNEWYADLQLRAQETSSQSELRREIYAA